MKKKQRPKRGDVCPTCCQVVKISLNNEERWLIAKRILRGESAVYVAREYEVSQPTALGCVERYVKTLTGFNEEEFNELRREPGIGMLSAARQTFWKLTPP
jgi:hypothetical protein